MSLQFTVHGLAQSAGSKRAFPFQKPDGTLGVRVTDDNKKSKSWQGHVTDVATEAMDGSELLEGPLQLVLLFCVPRPSGHFGTGKNSGVLKDSARPFPTVKPDITKLIRGVEDALTGVVWRDDAQVVAQAALKVYGEPARVEITVNSMDGGAVGDDGADTT